MHSNHGISDSEFHMWRAVIAFSLVDNFLSLEEQDILKGHFRNVRFSAEQHAILKKDFLHPKNVESLYKKITDRDDKVRFCALARALAWCDGDMERQEKMILKSVGCLRGAGEADILHESRDHPDFQECHQHYMRAGVVGLVRNYRVFEKHV